MPVSAAFHQLFAEAPPAHFEHVVHLRHGKNPERVRRAIFVALVTWLPLVVLAMAEDFVRGGFHVTSLVKHVAIHARFLIGAPLLVLAEAVCVPQLGAIARHFKNAGLVRESDDALYDDAIRATQRGVSSRLAEVVTWCLAFAIPIAAWRFMGHENLHAWHLTADGSGLSWAGYWHMLVSLPLLLVLMLGWFYRVALWGRFLHRVAALDLRLVPTHPDSTAGLRFVAYSWRSFAVLGFSLGTIVAGAAGSQVMAGADAIATLKRSVIGLLLFVTLLVVSPLLVFMPKLVGAMRQGLFEYGALAGRVGKHLEQKWVTKKREFPEEPLAVNDFSATTDLNQVVGTVYRILIVPIHVPSFISLMLATALPFVPVAFLMVPTQVLLESILRVLL